MWKKDRHIIVGGLLINLKMRNGKVIYAGLQGKNFNSDYGKKSLVADAFTAEFLEYIEKNLTKKEVLNLDNPLILKNQELRPMLMKQRKVLKNAFTKEADVLIDKGSKTKLLQLLNSGLIKNKTVISKAKDYLEKPSGFRGLVYNSLKSVMDFSLKDQVEKLKPDEIDMNQFTVKDLDIGKKELDVNDSKEVERKSEVSEAELQREMMKEFMLFMQKSIADITEMKNIVEKKESINKTIKIGDIIINLKLKNGEVNAASTANGVSFSKENIQLLNKKIQDHKEIKTLLEKKDFVNINNINTLFYQDVQYPLIFEGIKSNNYDLIFGGKYLNKKNAHDDISVEEKEFNKVYDQLQKIEINDKNLSEFDLCCLKRMDEIKFLLDTSNVAFDNALMNFYSWDMSLKNDILEQIELNKPKSNNDMQNNFLKNNPGMLNSYEESIKILEEENKKQQLKTSTPTIK